MTVTMITKAMKLSTLFPWLKNGIGKETWLTNHSEPPFEGLREWCSYPTDHSPASRLSDVSKSTGISRSQRVN